MRISSFRLLDLPGLNAPFGFGMMGTQNESPSISLLVYHEHTLRCSICHSFVACNHHALSVNQWRFSSSPSLEGRSRMLPRPAPEKTSWNPVLITIGIGILFAIVSFVVVTSQWGRPTTSVATVGFFGILFGILIIAIGCIWFIVKIVVAVSRSR
jgi:predicted permease